MGLGDGYTWGLSLIKQGNLRKVDFILTSSHDLSL